MSYDLSQLGKLRAVGDKDFQLMLSWRNMPGVRENMYTTHEISAEEHRAWWRRTKASESCQYFFYEYKGLPQGVIGFTNIDKLNNNVSWAFYSSPTAPRGTGSRMEILALEYAFNELKTRKIYCEVLAFNASVIKLHKRFGFKVEGVLKEQYSRGDNPVDIFRLGLLAADWCELRDEMIANLLELIEI